jgi:outer membrane protein assembly factor BamB
VARLVRKLLAWCVLTAATFVVAVAGDWLTAGGDTQHSGWQRYGRRLSNADAKELKLIWKRQVTSQTAATVSAPIILGPTITHRGVRELVFVSTARGDFYAFDADLGSIFWKSSFAGRPTAGTCPGIPAIASVVEPDPDDDHPGEPVADEDDDDEEPGAMRPIYLLAGDGRLHSIRPSDGADTAAPLEFLRPGAIASHLNFGSDMVYASAREGCSADQGSIRALDVKTPQAQPVFFSDHGRGPIESISIGFESTVYCAIGDKVVALTPGKLQLKSTFTASESVSLAPVLFKWQRKNWIAAGGQRELFLLDAAHLRRVAASDPGTAEFTGRIATWQDNAGARWIYAPARDSILAFQVMGTASHPRLQRTWQSSKMTGPGPPVVTRGVVLTISREPAHATLRALDAATGREFYSSVDTVTSPAASPELALANGHACFTTADNTLYCFGIPIER